MLGLTNIADRNDVRKTVFILENETQHTQHIPNVTAKNMHFSYFLL